LNKILLNDQNNKKPKHNKAIKNVAILISLNILHNYFDSATKLFLNLAKFLDTSAKSYLPIAKKIIAKKMMNTYS